LWYKGTCLVVPNVPGSRSVRSSDPAVPDAVAIPGLRQRVIAEVHDVAAGGHLGQSKTLEKVQRLFWWPGVVRDVRDYVASCPSCQRSKAPNKLPKIPVQPLPVPAHRWESVSMDLITALPVTQRGHDAVVVFVDRLSKMVHFAPTSQNVTSQELADLFLSHVFRLHGMPDNIVSDRDVRFMSSFWSEFFARVGTRLAMTSVYHPQADGQTERVNRVLEEMLRSYVGHLHTDWDREVGRKTYQDVVAYRVIGWC
jgi:hypothetical protein